MNIVPLDFSTQLRAQLTACVEENRLAVPAEIIERLIDVGRYLHRLPLEITPMPFSATPPEGLDWRYRDQWKRRAAEYQAEDVRLKETMPPLRDQAIVSCLLTYLRHWPGAEAGPFRVKYSGAVNIAQVSYELMEPLRNKELQEVHAFKEVLKAFDGNAVSVAKRQLKRQMDGPIYPQEYQGPRDRIVDTYFTGTPFKELLNIEVPLALRDKDRFDGAYIVGRKGLGKSTLFEHLINDDIKRLPAVSILVMDSQGEIIPKLARLSNVEPLLIGPNNPAPLNPFYLGNVEQTISVLEYCLGTAIEADVTAIQKGPLGFAIRAVAKSKRPTLRLVEALIEKPELKEHKRLMERADPDTRDYFRSEAWTEINDLTRRGILQRLALIKNNQTLWQMLNMDGITDLDAQFKQGRFILVDTNLHSLELTRVFGRFFISLLHLATLKRRREGYGYKRTTFVHIDELPDYCPADHDDEKFRDTLDKCRKQLIGITVASQRADTSQLHQRVLAALDDSTIKVKCLEWYEDEGYGLADLSARGTTKRIINRPYRWPPLIDRQAYDVRYATPKSDSVDKEPPDLPRSI